MKHGLQFALTALALSACATTPHNAHIAPAPPQIDDPYFQAGAARVAQAASLPGSARNVILFVGDGMSVTTVTAARIYAGQSQGVDGESYNLALDTFPHLALSRTYGNDAQVSDSAPTATAMTSGVKTNASVIGLDGGVTPGQCEDQDQYMVRSLFEIAEDAGLATGVVSTARITHATPAATYAHVANRDWENDVELARQHGEGCTDIASQLIAWPYGDGFEIVLGGGRANFLPNTMADPGNPSRMGARADGRNLADEWAAKPEHVTVFTAGELSAAPASAHILGLFSPSHMTYDSARPEGPDGEPSLAEMTAAAIRRLSQNESGYVLMVEGGRIDHAHHEGRAGEALSETVALDNAIRTALEMTSREDTLILATADHSHTMTMAGYASRGNPILGLSAVDDHILLGADGKPYTTLGYANGPGAVMPSASDPSAIRAYMRSEAAEAGEPADFDVPAPEPREDLTDIDTTALSFHQQSTVPMQSETHGGEDVPLYAWGAGDDAVGGTMEENAIFHIMARALGFEWQE